MSTEDIRCRITEEELGTFWPQWHVVKRLGGGADGEVFEIVRDNHGVQTYSALKVLRTGSWEDCALPPMNAGPDDPGTGGNGSAGDNIPEVFMNEIRIMEALRGAPNIVLIDDFYFRKGTDTSSLYVRMELLKSFVDVMSDHQRSGIQFTIAEVQKIGKDICTALSFCEQKGIIHRDINPANLYVDKFGDYKVGDFGSSKWMEAAHSTLMPDEVGTISYMAPEIFAGRPYNNTVDIYSLGLVLYQLLNSGRMPFLPADGRYNEQEIDAANYRRLHGEELPSLAGTKICGDTVSARLDSVIRRACDPDSHRRYRTAKEFCDALSGQEAGPDITKDMSKTVYTPRGGTAEPFEGNAPVNSSGPAETSETENVYARKSPAKRQEGGSDLKKPFTFFAAFLLCAAMILIIIVEGSKLGHKDPIQTVSTENETGTDADKDETPASTGSETGTGADKDETPAPASEATDQSDTAENEEKKENDTEESPVSGETDQAAPAENEEKKDNDTEESPVSEETDQAVPAENEDSIVIDKEEDLVLKAPVQSVSLGDYHSAAIDADGNLWLWGYNDHGQLGDGSTENSHEPKKIMDGVQSVTLGSYSSAAIKTDGSLWLWGINKLYQLGDGSRENRYEPVKIMDGVQTVSLGGPHGAAIKEDGSLWLWGNNFFGQLGDGSRENRCEPVKIMDGVQSVSLGDNHSAAIKTDGSLGLWGHNKFGKLGDGSTEYRYEPVKIMDGVQSVSLGDDHSAAIKTDGSLCLWGYNYVGQLGDGSTENRYEPVKIMDGAQTVILGKMESAVIKTDGSLWLWGINNYYSPSRYEPEKIMDDVQSVSLGNEHIAVIKADGSLWLRGWNAYGQLGDGSTQSNDKEFICIAE